VNKLLILVVLAGSLSLQAETNECMIVRSAEGHRFKNSMIAGALTGGIGFAAGAAKKQSSRHSPRSLTLEEY
jgi:hypothetical protein